jgi:ATP-dependent DNA ligase
MLAKNLDDYIDKIDFSQGVLVQNKYNGVRCIATKEAAKVLLKSRKGELWVSVVHINKDLEPFFAKFPDAVLDGELYNYDLRQHLNELIHLVRQTKDITAEDLAASEKMVRFYIYDGYGFDGLTETDSYLRRKAWIDKNLPKYSKYYREVPTKLVTSMAEVEKIYGEYLADGQEGAIIRLPGAPYEHKRSKFLLKYKPENDDEGEILDVEDGDGNYRDRAKTSWILWKGKKFKATWMGDEIQGRNILKNKKDWIGRTITFKYTHLTGKNGLPEYARIDPDNCFKGDR